MLSVLIDYGINFIDTVSLIYLFLAFFAPHEELALVRSFKGDPKPLLRFIAIAAAGTALLSLSSTLETVTGRIHPLLSSLTNLALTIAFLKIVILFYQSKLRVWVYLAFSISFMMVFRTPFILLYGTINKALALDLDAVYGIHVSVILSFVAFVLSKRFLVGQYQRLNFQIPKITFSLPLMAFITFTCFNLITIGDIALSRYTSKTVILGALILSNASWLISIYLIYTNTAHTAKLKQNEEQLEYYRSHQRIISELQGFWHEHANLMQTVQGLLESTKPENQYLHKALSDFATYDKEHNLKEVIQIIQIQNPLISSTLIHKLAYAKELNVTLNITTALHAHVFFNARLLCEALSIVLDNAIEAAHFSDQQVNVVLESTESHQRKSKEPKPSGNTNETHLDPANAALPSRIVTRILARNTYVSQGGSPLKYGTSNKIGIQRLHHIFSSVRDANLDINVTENTYEVILTFEHTLIS